MENKQSERRVNETLSDESIYKLSNIDQAMDSERRSDELDRLREVNEQKKTWFRTIMLTTAMTCIFLLLAAWGHFYG